MAALNRNVAKTLYYSHTLNNSYKNEICCFEQFSWYKYTVTTNEMSSYYYGQKKKLS